VSALPTSGAGGLAADPGDSWVSSVASWRGPPPGLAVFTLIAAEATTRAPPVDGAEALAMLAPRGAPQDMPTVHDFTADTLTGKQVKLDDYEGKVLLIVNTASKCGLTPQYKGLEALYETYKDRGLVVLGFPCNQFGSQEPGSADDISSFCEINYGVTFPMFAKIEVNGPGTHPLFAHLKAEGPSFLGTRDLKWNFSKFLVGKDGKVVDRYAPTTTPESIAKDIEKLLK
jgi:glutathione peroxidase